MDLSAPTLSLTASLILCAYLTFRYMTPPNPPPPKPYEKDTLSIIQTKNNGSRTRKSVLTITWLFHLFLILLPSYRTNFCWHASYLNAPLFTWSRYTITFILVIITAAPIRLLAYKTLGKVFTFQLATPSKLITTGVYRYVQHPSYICLFLVNSPNYFFLLRMDGVSACWMPEFILRFKWLGLLFGCVITGITLADFSLRIREEEAMMRKKFGAKWETWHRKTARFLPRIF
jgi:protein-S-isoprenylcysteine O-methyltransferase Ste14